jgi:hypothetical protein
MTEYLMNSELERSHEPSEGTILAFAWKNHKNLRIADI